MNEAKRVFSAGIVDFNTRRRTSEQANELGIPPDLQPFAADLRQYPLKIAEFLPIGTLWFQDQPWYFRSVMSNPEMVEKLRKSDVLILSGSGMSAYKFQEGNYPIDSPSAKDQEYLIEAEKIVRDHLGEGKWVLGDCFGGQLSVHAIGGKLGRLPSNQYGNTVTEAGFIPHELRPEGRRDEVFGHLPETFYASHFHNDFVEKLPTIGTEVQTSSGMIEVIKADVLAVRQGYLDRDGLKNQDTAYIHAAVIEFNNGARLYHTQFHPEMSTPERADFFARYVGYLLEKEEEMGPEYAANAKIVPEDADFLASSIITRFAEAYKNHLHLEFLQAVTPAIIYSLRRYEIN